MPDQGAAMAALIEKQISRCDKSDAKNDDNDDNNENVNNDITSSVDQGAKNQ